MTINKEILISNWLYFIALRFYSGLFLNCSELYLNGNNLESDGAMKIIKLCTEQAEYEAIKRAEEIKRKEEEEAEKAAKG